MKLFMIQKHRNSYLEAIGKDSLAPIRKIDDYCSDKKTHLCGNCASFVNIKYATVDYFFFNHQYTDNYIYWSCSG